MKNANGSNNKSPRYGRPQLGAKTPLDKTQQVGSWCGYYFVAQSFVRNIIFYQTKEIKAEDTV